MNNALHRISAVYFHWPVLKTREHRFVSLQTAEEVIGHKEEVVTGKWRTWHNHCAFHHIFKGSAKENYV
jgi:hypothetical protein